MHSSGGGLELALVLLLAAVIAVPVFKRLGLGAVLAYLVAGVMLGPDGLGFVQDADRILNAAEIGVVMLLFVIGLELSPARLKLMRKPIFGAGGLQVFITAAVLAVVMWLELGYFKWKGAIVVGVALALSSTAVCLQLLAERKELNTDFGRLAFAILLFQDLIAIPLLAAIPLLGGSADNDTLSWQAAAKAIGAIALVVLGGRFVLRHLFRAVARTGIPEVFTGAALLVVLGSAWLLQLAGLSAGLGAFLAGVLLADSEYRHELESQLEPFKGLLLGLFFVSVGLSMDFRLLLEQPLTMLALVGLLLLVKGALLWPLGRVLGRLGRADALRLAVLLAGGGEFAFVTLRQAAARGLLEPSLQQLLVLAITLSMALTPLLVALVGRLLARVEASPRREYDTITADAPRVIIAGYGRMGQIVARVLRAQGVPFVALDHSVEQLDLVQRFGRWNDIFYGDPARPELLRAAGAGQAEVFVLAGDDPESSLRIARVVRRLFPHLKIVARARNRQHVWRLMDLGVDEPVRETYYSSLKMTEQTLTALGLSAAEAAERVRRFDRHDNELLRRQYLVYDDEAKIRQTSREALADLEQLFRADAAPEAAQDEDGSSLDEEPSPPR